MTSDITDEQWQRLRVHYGDLAYEHPEMHKVMLDILDRAPDVPPDDGVELK